MTTLSRLEALGIRVAADDDGPLETKLLVHSAADLRSLLDLGLDAEGRQAHYEALTASSTGTGGSAPTASATAHDGGASIVDRITEHVFGNRELSAQDEAEIAPAFPLTVNVSTASNLEVSSRYDLSTPDGSPRVAAFNTVVLAQGGYFVCANTPLTFTCNNLVRQGDSGGNNADFNILGLVGDTPPTPATPGTASQASPGGPGECSSVGVAGHGGGTGTRGNQGTQGTDGTRGNQGKPSMQATIKISNMLDATQLTIFTQSGPGGQGGNGGQGGTGQQGGDGGNGVTCECTGNAGGPGNDGGQGGQGGRAGDGGNGVDAAANIVIYVPGAADMPTVTTSSAPAPPGAAGSPGPGGAGGAGGAKSKGGKNNSGGGAGGSGSPGGSGGQGSPGTVSGAPSQIMVTPL